MRSTEESAADITTAIHMSRTMTDWTQGVVVANTHWTDNLFSLQIDANLKDFTAGQYTSLALDIDGERHAQPYSILSRPQRRPLEFFFYTNLEGELSARLGELQSGDSIWVQTQPEGTFTLNQVADASQLWLLATSTGVAPFFSMLMTEEIWQRFDKVILVYAARTSDDLCYRSLTKELQSSAGLIFIPLISREDRKDIQRGRIPELLENGTLERLAGYTISAADSQIMLCGNPGMVKDATAVLKARGLQENQANRTGQITFESYW